MAMTAADSVLVPLQCEFFALEGLSQLIKTIDSIEKKGIDITHEKIADSHLVIELFDDKRKINQKKGRVSVLNKIDLINEKTNIISKNDFLNQIEIKNESSIYE